MSPCPRIGGRDRDVVAVGIGRRGRQGEHVGSVQDDNEEDHERGR